jgi:hypothetical protein
MATSASARKPEATQVYVAISSAEVHHDGHDIFNTVDQTFVMGDDPLLAQVPHLFARVSTRLAVREGLDHGIR